MHLDCKHYNEKQVDSDREICDLLANIIESTLNESESKFWHGHPVWFLDGNPIVGYGKLKNCVRLLFWSGQSFQSSEVEMSTSKNSQLKKTGSFKAAEIRFTGVDQINVSFIEKCLVQSRNIQWDYKNIVKRKGKLLRLK